MYSVIIVAGGSGSRMQNQTPKQFELLKDKPLIVYSIEKFLAFDPDIQLIVALPQEYFSLFFSIQKEFQLPQMDLVIGGETRFHSVKNALEKIKSKIKFVAVHDAARPLVSLVTIQDTFTGAEKYGAAIPVIDINESLREINSLSSNAVDRKNYKMVQTPQCFNKKILVEAYRQNYLSTFTDDATVVEASGHKIHLTDGNIENIKITYRNDLIIASALL